MQTLTNLLAKTVSQLFGPFSLLPLVLVIVPLFNVGLSHSQLIILGPILVVTHIISPIAVFIYFFVVGKVSDLDVTIRREREQLYTLASIGPWLGALAGFVWGAPLLAKLLVLLAITVTLLTFFTYVEKVSAHMAVNTAAYFIINILFDWRYWWLFLLLILIAWSRRYLHRHTVHQLILGTLIPVVVFLTGMRILL